MTEQQTFPSDVLRAWVERSQHGLDRQVLAEQLLTADVPNTQRALRQRLAQVFGDEASGRLDGAMADFRDFEARESQEVLRRLGEGTAENVLEMMYSLERNDSETISLVLRGFMRAAGPSKELLSFCEKALERLRDEKLDIYRSQKATVEEAHQTYAENRLVFLEVALSHGHLRFSDLSEDDRTLIAAEQAEYLKALQESYISPGHYHRMRNLIHISQANTDDQRWLSEVDRLSSEHSSLCSDTGGRSRPCLCCDIQSLLKGNEESPWARCISSYYGGMEYEEVLVQAKRGEDVQNRLPSIVEDIQDRLTGYCAEAHFYPIAFFCITLRRFGVALPDSVNSLLSQRGTPLGRYRADEYPLDSPSLVPFFHGLSRRERPGSSLGVSLDHQDLGESFCEALLSGLFEEALPAFDDPHFQSAFQGRIQQEYAAAVALPFNRSRQRVVDQMREMRLFNDLSMRTPVIVLRRLALLQQLLPFADSPSPALIKDLFDEEDQPSSEPAITQEALADTVSSGEKTDVYALLVELSAPDTPLSQPRSFLSAAAALAPLPPGLRRRAFLVWRDHQDYWGEDIAERFAPWLASSPAAAAQVFAGLNAVKGGLGSTAPSLCQLTQDYPLTAEAIVRAVFHLDPGLQDRFASSRQAPRPITSDELEARIRGLQFSASYSPDALEVLQLGSLSSRPVADRETLVYATMCLGRSQDAEALQAFLDDVQTHPELAGSVGDLFDHHRSIKSPTPVAEVAQCVPALATLWKSLGAQAPLFCQASLSYFFEDADLRRFGNALSHAGAQRIGTLFGSPVLAEALLSLPEGIITRDLANAICWVFAELESSPSSAGLATPQAIEVLKTDPDVFPVLSSSRLQKEQIEFVLEVRRKESDEICSPFIPLYCDYTQPGSAFDKTLQKAYARDGETALKRFLEMKTVEDEINGFRISDVFMCQTTDEIMEEAFASYPPRFFAAFVSTLSLFADRIPILNWKSARILIIFLLFDTDQDELQEAGMPSFQLSEAIQQAVEDNYLMLYELVHHGLPFAVLRNAGVMSLSQEERVAAIKRSIATMAATAGREAGIPEEAATRIAGMAAAVGQHAFRLSSFFVMNWDQLASDQVDFIERLIQHKGSMITANMDAYMICLGSYEEHAFLTKGIPRSPMSVPHQGPLSAEERAALHRDLASFLGMDRGQDDIVFLSVDPFVFSKYRELPVGGTERKEFKEVILTLERQLVVDPDMRCPEGLDREVFFYVIKRLTGYERFSHGSADSMEGMHEEFVRAFPERQELAHAHIKRVSLPQVRQEVSSNKRHQLIAGLANPIAEFRTLESPEHVEFALRDLLSRLTEPFEEIDHPKVRAVLSTLDTVSEVRPFEQRLLLLCVLSFFLEKAQIAPRQRVDGVMIDTDAPFRELQTALKKMDFSQRLLILKRVRDNSLPGAPSGGMLPEVEPQQAFYGTKALNQLISFFLHLDTVLSSPDVPQRSQLEELFAPLVEAGISVRAKRRKQVQGKSVVDFCEAFLADSTGRLKSAFGNTVKSLAEELLHIKPKVLEGETQDVTYMMANGLIDQFAGLIANACYLQCGNLSRFRQIIGHIRFIDSYPEHGAVLSDDGDQESSPEFRGGCLLMRTFAVEDEQQIPVFLLRADNPHASWLEEVSVKHHKEAIELFAEEQGEKILKAEGYTGKFYVMRPKESASNIAMTNDASLHAVVWDEIEKRDPVHLGEEVNFNSYNITENCVVMRTGRIEA